MTQFLADCTTAGTTTCDYDKYSAYFDGFAKGAYFNFFHRGFPLAIASCMDILFSRIRKVDSPTPIESAQAFSVLRLPLYSIKLHLPQVLVCPPRR